MNCTYQTRGGKICNSKLFKENTNFSALHDKGIAPWQSSTIHPNEFGVINTPICTYYTHSLKKWTKLLLALDSMEDQMDSWKNDLAQVKGTTNIQQSFAWKAFAWTPTKADDIKPLQLVFSIFIDWFNPWGNKISGKEESLGVIILNFLNLPPLLRHNPAFSLLYSIIPGPSSPDVVKISNCLQSLVDELMELKDGFTVLTAQNPEGRQVYLQVLPIPGDLLAIHKAVGFGSPAALKFRGWCDANLN
ncbi:hypothetical protein O181_040933 [Austropuccinia psidii MF-1]|uniref:Uncharacterized protein n=1 Tax=Austropuccinia psidii MF-1 TaxID=1389203 RepID=A0A9Q3HDC4_9BASI|nr:hypothetical protein [Austropuccinia psidii MF-1]